MKRVHPINTIRYSTALYNNDLLSESVEFLSMKIASGIGSYQEDTRHTSMHRKKKIYVESLKKVRYKNIKDFTSLETNVPGSQNA